MTGRPTKLTETVIEDVRRILPTLLYSQTVCDYLRIDRTTWSRWARRGRKEAGRLERDGADPTRPSEVLYLEFYLLTKKAVAESAFHALGIIRKAADKNWTAAAWLLERRFPQEWGKETFVVAELKKLVKELEAKVAQLGGQPAIPGAEGEAGD